MQQEAQHNEPDAPSIAATRDEPVGQVTRNHVLFGVAIIAGLLVVLLIASSP